MKILLTGVAGFLGSHIATKLLVEGHEVIGIDNFLTGSEENISVLLGHEFFTFENVDIRDPYFIKCDAILNFACPASPKHYQSDPVHTIETNFIGVSNLLKLAKDTGAKFIQASTSEVYGDPLQTPQRESYWGNVNPIGIRACYDEGKRIAETLCFDYKRKYGVNSQVVRIFNTYGPNMSLNDGRVVSNFIVQALNGELITIFGNGKQTRSFCYVSDLVEGIYNLLESNISLGSPINLGNTEEININQLASKIILLTNSVSKVKFEVLPGDDPTQRKPDISLANKILGWSPKISIDQGLALSIDYFKKKI
jgi:UDP-glucuronate decarboxylase